MAIYRVMLNFPAFYSNVMLMFVFKDVCILLTLTWLDAPKKWLYFLIKIRTLATSSQKFKADFYRWGKIGTDHFHINKHLGNKKLQKVR